MVLGSASFGALHNAGGPVARPRVRVRVRGTVGAVGPVAKPKRMRVGGRRMCGLMAGLRVGSEM